MTEYASSKSGDSASDVPILHTINAIFKSGGKIYSKKNKLIKEPLFFQIKYLDLKVTLVLKLHCFLVKADKNADRQIIQHIFVTNGISSIDSIKFNFRCQSLAYCNQNYGSEYQIR